MDNLYSSFYLYRKYEIIGDELIDLGITSVDADGTLEPVIKEECDPACGCPEPIYRWVQTEDTVCVGEEPAVQYRWTACGTTCDNANKYQNNIKEQSLDEGLTWTVVIPEEYSASTLVQQDSYDCGYRTGTTSSSTYCNGDDLYVDVYYRTSRDSGTTWTTASTTPTLVEAGGCATPTIEYRWTQSGTTCIGYDKYQNNIKEQSTDGGETWTVVIPEEYSASTLIESQSTDCGYVPPTPTIDGKFKLTLNDSSTVTAACDSTSAVTGGEVARYANSAVSLVIGDCVTSIDFAAFMSFTGLTSVIIPNNVTSIDASVFHSCYSLTDITIPSGVTSINAQLFSGCRSLTSVTMSDNVTSIGNNAFSNCSGLTSIDIPSGLTSIGDGAFTNCYSLTSIVIPDSVTSIDNYAFQICSGLTSITVNATTPPTLGSDVFNNTNNCPIYVPCESVEAYKAASGWSTYASRIEGIPPCGSPTPASPKFTLTLNDSSIISAECDSTSAITRNETSAYSASVASVVIGDCVTDIGDYAFRNCSGITNIYIPNSVTSIGGWAFYGCSSLTSITIPNSVTRIKYGAFSVCTALASCTIGSGVTSIAGSAFDRCSSLTSIDIPDSVTSIDSQAFGYCTGLTSVTIGNSVTSINSATFKGCSSLTSVIIPNSVTSIGGYAFEGCSSLTSVTIGSGVTVIYRNAFNGCSGLQSIYCLPTTPPSLSMGVFDGSTCPIYVSAENVEAYKASSSWSSYADRIQAIP